MRGDIDVPYRLHAMTATDVPGVFGRVGIGFSPRGLILALIILAFGSPSLLVWSLTEPGPSRQFWMFLALPFVVFAVWYAAFSSVIVVAVNREGLGFHVPLAFLPSSDSVIPCGDAQSLHIHGHRLIYRSPRRLRFLVLWTNPQRIEAILRAYPSLTSALRGTSAERSPLLPRAESKKDARVSLLLLPVLALCLGIGATLTFGLTDLTALASVLVGLLLGLLLTLGLKRVRERARAS